MNVCWEKYDVVQDRCSQDDSIEAIYVRLPFVRRVISMTLIRISRDILSTHILTFRQRTVSMKSTFLLFGAPLRCRRRSGSARDVANNSFVFVQLFVSTQLVSYVVSKQKQKT